MKKIVAFALFAAMAVTMLTGCSSKGGENGTVNVYNWGEYIDKSILKDFEKQTGITVNYRNYASNEQMYSVLKQGGTNYDVIVPSDYMLSRMIEEDMLEKIDFANIPNMEKLDKNFLNLEYDPENLYSVPYMWGTVGIIYNSKKITEPVDSWSALFDQRYKGQILQFDNSRDAVATALFYLGYPVNTTDPAQIKDAYALLTTQKPLLQRYCMDEIFDLLEGDEAAIGTYYAGDFLSMVENNPDLKFVVPKEGSNRFVDCMAIPKGAKNKANAEAFINFMCDTEVSLKNMQELGYASPNLESKAELKKTYDMADAAQAAEYAVIYPDDELLKNCQVFTNLPTETLTLYADQWTKLKAE